MMRLGTYISKHLASFLAFILILFFVNVLAFGWTFYNVMTEDYGESSPQAMLEEVSRSATDSGLPEKMTNQLNNYHIWAMFLDASGNVVWAESKPDEVPDHFSIQDVAVFTKGYIADYPVFVQCDEKGLLVLGYPKDSYTKLTGNYFSMHAIQRMPLFITVMLAVDFLLLFLTYFFSKRKILRNTEPLTHAIEMLADGNPVSLDIHGELAPVASSVNKASQILSRQNQARANWISGVSHDIRTPLSMIMGYAQRIANETSAGSDIHEEALIIGKHSAKIKNLVQDLNLVSQLEYAMQPLNKKKVRLSTLIRTYIVNLMNEGIPESYTITFDSTPKAENEFFYCDDRLIERAVNNLVQNSITHNPRGCSISLNLDSTESEFILTIADNGRGLSKERLRELQEIPHYMESTDDRLNLRHGLGLIIVHQIVEAHQGAVCIESKSNKGYKTMIKLKKNSF